MWRKASAKRPSARRKISHAAATGSPRKARANRFARTSVSVSERNATPWARSSSFRAMSFSRTPLWTTTTSPVASVCGWALTRFGRPCVAHRVCPMPETPARRWRSHVGARSSMRPLSFSTRIDPFRATATPALSYPR